MNPTKKNRVSFDDMPNMMAELLDEMRAISSRVKDLEDSYSIRKSDVNSREILMFYKDEILSWVDSTRIK